MKTIETKMPFCKSVSRCAKLWLVAFGIFLATRACLVPTVLAQTSCESYTFTTLAGNAGYGSADGAGSAARFGDPDGNSPTGVAVDSVGNVYVADTNHTIRKVTPAGVVTTLAGTAGIVGSADGMGNGARFNQPSGVALDSAGNVYVADSGNGTIRKVTPGGMVTTVAGVAGSRGSARFYLPSGLAVDSAGNVYVADFTTIRKVTPAGAVTTLAGLAGNPGSADGTGSSARFSRPSGVAVDSVGNVYVADSGNGTIRKVTPVGVVTTLAGKAGIGGSEDGRGSGARFRSPRGIAVDSAGNVYVADAGANTIRKVTPAGVVTTLAGLAGGPGSADGTGSAARFSFLQGVAVDSAGNVYVADTGNSTIRKVTPEGVVTTLVGLAGSFGSADGTGSAARFYRPPGVAVDSVGNVYVADSGNNTIRKVTPEGVVTTIAGLPPQYDNDNGGILIAKRSGSADGTGSAARFNQPSGIAVDSAGSVYVADQLNATIRKVTPAGVVGTLAALAGISGSADGTGSAARFGIGSILFTDIRFGPAGVAVDSAGNVYVADTANNTIRKGYSENVPAVIVTFSPGFGFNGGQFGFNLTGPAGRLVVVETSTNLVSWLPIWTNTFAGALHFSDPQSGVYSNRFYRAHLP